MTKKASVKSFLFGINLTRARKLTQEQQPATKGGKPEKETEKRKGREENKLQRKREPYRKGKE